jgi:hypothetical protein
VCGDAEPAARTAEHDVDGVDDNITIPQFRTSLVFSKRNPVK